MSDDKLTKLRNQIDSIDNDLLDLLRQRANVIEEVRGVKGKQAVYIRPGREASMLRILVKQPMGHIPQGLIHRLWREMIGAFTLQEGAMKVAIPSLDGEEGFWDIARDHFGSFTPIQSFSNPTAALRAVLNNTHQLAALPHPREGDGDCWWRLLLAEQQTIPNIFYAFPFDGLRGNARKVDHQGIVVGVLPPESTGQDRSILVLEWKNAPDMRELQTLLNTLPYKHAHHVYTPSAKEPACSWVELEGFIKNDDAELKAWFQAQKEHLLRHKIIGAYPQPMKSNKE